MTIAVEETKETPGTEMFDGPRKRNDSDEWSSPRGVLEIPILSSDSDNGSGGGGGGRSSSCGSLAKDKSPAHRAPLGENQGLQWRNFIDDKWKTVKRLSTIPLLSGYEISRKNLRRKICRLHAVNHETDDSDTVAPKPTWRNFGNAEIAAATDNFCSENLIGKGGHAEVYKGSLPNGQFIAVKRITKMEKDDENRVRDFLSELGMIAHINHPNAAKLIGFSADGGLHLVLQYLPQGSLASVLHGSKESLEWNKRLKVARGVAEGLKYLHCECQRRVIHRDITASNILLTDDYEPQISDFGLAKWLPEKCLQHVVHPIEGTFGYMAPEYFMHGIVNEKTDVFAFGVLLLELITGRRAVDSCQQSLVMWAKPLLENNKIKEIADPRLGDAYNIGEMKRAMSTALACLHHLPNMRPGMDRVVELLRGEGGQIDLKEKSLGGRGLLFCDVEDYTSTSYLNDLDRHRQLILE